MAGRNYGFINNETQGKGSEVNLKHNPTEFFADAGQRDKRAQELRREGWQISVGQMRREDGKDFYVRSWRRLQKGVK